MRVMMLTAGLGERMLPLTETLPKPAIPVLGRPLAIQNLRWLRGFGVEEAVLNLHHLPDVLPDLLGDGSDHGLPLLRYSPEEALLGTAGGVVHARELLRGDGPIVVCNGDFLADIDLAAVLETHRRSGLPATLVLAEPRPEYSTIEIDPEGRVLSLAGRPDVDPSRVASSHLFTGCHVVEESLLDRLPATGASDWVRDLYWDLAREGRLGSFVHPGFWREYGSLRQYLAGSLSLLEASVRLRRRVTDHDPVRRIGGAFGALGPAVRYAARARFGGFVSLAFASHVSDDCLIEDSVVMPESWIGPSCRLGCCIVGPGVELPGGFEGKKQLICKRPRDPAGLPEGARIEGELAVVPLRPPRKA
jgi:NDP-sugar pyrophosphorylase family protein